MDIEDAIINIEQTEPTGRRRKTTLKISVTFVAPVVKTQVVLQTFLSTIKAMIKYLGALGYTTEVKSEFMKANKNELE
jgi:hypothetical protein